MPKLILTAWLLTLFGPIPPQVTDQINSRRSFYPPYLANVFENKALYYLDRVEDQVFKLLDPNYYLFGSHPREND